MIDFNTAIELIRRNGGFKPNRRDTSYYRTYTMEDSRPMQARVSNHGTWLWTWYDKDYDPSYAINFCVVFSENGEYDSDVSVDMDIKDEEGNVIGRKKSFEVIQYVYNCQLLDINDATLINQQVQSIWRNKGFNDPFANTPKKAKVMRLKPNEPIEQIVENKQCNTNRNMNRQIIRLTESDLHRIVKKSVSKILKESYADDRYNMGTFCNSGDKQYDSLSDKLFAYIEDWGISRQMEGNKTFQEGRKMLHQALKTLEQGFREYNNYDGGGASDGDEGFSDYSGGSLY